MNGNIKQANKLIFFLGSTYFLLAGTLGYLMIFGGFGFLEIFNIQPEKRLANYLEFRSELITVSFLLSLTGYVQIALSAVIYMQLKEKEEIFAGLSLVFGILAGFCFAVGYSRWAVVTPFFLDTLLAEGSGSSARVSISIIENGFNRFGGSLIGEHVGPMCWSIWFGCLAIMLLRSKQYARYFGYIAIFLAIMTLGISVQQLGIRFTVLNLIITIGIQISLYWYLALAWVNRPWRSEDNGELDLSTSEKAIFGLVPITISGVQVINMLGLI